MKTKIAFIAAALAVLASPLRADVVETNLTIALKFYANTTDAVPKGNFVSLNYRTGTIKNADIIDAINYALDEEYSLKSKIIRRDEFDDQGNLIEENTAYLIRDKDLGDLDITDIISYVPLAQVAKFKYSTVNGTGTFDLITTSYFDIVFDRSDEFEEMQLFGIDRQKIKYVTVKQTGNLAGLLSFSSKVHGDGFLWFNQTDDFWDGILEGTIKVSGAKVIPPDA